MKSKIEFINLSKEYVEESVKLALLNYELEKQVNHHLPQCNKQYFYSKLDGLFQNGIGKVALSENRVIGYLGFDKIFNTSDSEKGATSPLYGYGVVDGDREKIMGMLFQETAKELCQNHAGSLRVSVYAHDKDVLNLYIMSGFCMNMTDVVRNVKMPITDSELEGYTFKEMTKNQLMKHKTDVIELYRELINHLRQSPVFYPCHQYLPIEERFHDFLSDEMRIFCVFYEDELIGMIDTEPAHIAFAAPDEKSIRMGDVSLMKAHRSKGVARALLSYANDQINDDCYTRAYVTHGTINPTARGFWDKYFENYSYTLTRKIDKRMLGVIDMV